MDEKLILREFLQWLESKDYKIGTLDYDCFSESQAEFDSLEMTHQQLIDLFMKESSDYGVPHKVDVEVLSD